MLPGDLPSTGSSGIDAQRKSTGLGSSFHAAASSKYPNYVADKELFAKFLADFRDIAGEATYVKMASRVARREETIFHISLDDLATFGQSQLAERITMNVLGYMDELQKVVDDFVPSMPYLTDPIDFLQAEARAVGTPIPSVLTRRYETVLSPMAALSSPCPIRSLRAASIGTLCVVQGVCIAATAVRPKLRMLTSVCEVCAEATFQTVVGDRVTPQLVCQSEKCKLKNSLGRLLPQYKASKFSKFQELRVQELPIHVPKGAIPRTIRVLCEGEQTRVAMPGQTVKIIGVYVPDPGTGHGADAFRASTMVKTMFRALHVALEKRSYDEAADDMKRRLDEVRRYPNRDAIIEKLTRSIAPEIFGMEDVKKALLCLLVGGSSMANGIQIRSDLNMCMMGDPGVAKSQLLKWIATVAPRSVFTTGKGSSGVGLTAAVTRDPHTGETVLEGGALVLSDNGICCIDEFDKMDETDRTSLHEVMEQQSVSIAKAGIITSLNARTSVLAASNPKWGRWRRNASPSENVNLPPALLSRFDILWLLLDEADRDRDSELSMHVTYVHVHGVAPGKADEEGLAADLHVDYFSKDFLRAYVGEVKRIHPYLDDRATQIITDIYCEMRQQRVRQSNVVTARTLLSLVRISQALARLRMSAQVTDVDVREAARLVEASKASLQDRGSTTFRNVAGTDAGVFTLVKEFSRGRLSIDMGELRGALSVKGVAERQLQQCLDTYKELGVWTLTGGGATLTFSQA